MASRSLWAFLFKLRIRQSDQMLFAEAFSQALGAGMDVGEAVIAAADANPSRRFRAALYEMAQHCLSGEGLESSLARTGVAVGGDLLGALRVAEERGGLAEQLAAYARRCDPKPAARLAAAVGRPDEVTRFAAALADLLVDRRMTVALVADAAQLAAGGGSRIAEVVARVVERMKDGETFAWALEQEPRMFDRLFCRLVASTDGRQALRTVLARLSSG